MSCASLRPRICRAVYDGGEADSFRDALDKYIARADADIEKLCDQHYKVMHGLLGTSASSQRLS